MFATSRLRTTQRLFLSSAVHRPAISPSHHLTRPTPQITSTLCHIVPAPQASSKLQFHTSTHQSFLNKWPDSNDLKNLSKWAQNTTSKIVSSDTTKQVGKYALGGLKQAGRASKPAARLAGSAVWYPVSIMSRRLKKFFYLSLLAALVTVSAYLIYTIDKHPRLMQYWGARNLANAELESFHSANYKVSHSELQRLQNVMEEHPSELVTILGPNAQNLVKAAFSQVKGVKMIHALNDENATSVLAKCSGPFLESSLRSHSNEYMEHLIRKAHRWIRIKSMMPWASSEVMDKPTLAIYYKTSPRSNHENLHQLIHVADMILKHHHCRIILMVDDGRSVKDELPRGAPILHAS